MQYKNNKALKCLLCGITMITAGLVTSSRGAAKPPGPELVLVENGESRAPIVIFADAPPLTRMAADELAQYIEKTSGARPEVLEGRPDPLPDRAIWVGFQPVLKELFPELDFDFKHPEEILIAAGEAHMVIAGRDRWDPDNLEIDLGRVTINGVQQEYGTHNAVYTFLQDFLGVRWLWPGDLGEDVLSLDTIAFKPFEYRYHPQVRARGGMLPWSQITRGIGSPGSPFIGGAGSGRYWLRAQRNQLCEFAPMPAGHGFPVGQGFGPEFNWFDRFFESNPEYFALQPDGTRGGGKNPYPSAGTVKMCHSNPDVAGQWLDDVAAVLEKNPNQRVFLANPGDGALSGHCICQNCLAWDQPGAEPRRLTWQGIAQEYVALSDREVRFANRVARGLRERFPDRDLYAVMMAYGQSVPGPVEAVPEENVIVGIVASFLFRSDDLDRFTTIGKTYRERIAEWGQVSKNVFWRPNVGGVGWQWGMPDISFRRTINDIRYVAENNWMGFFIDYVREHWSTQGPMYYLIAQLTWNPQQDGEAILADFFQRAYGPAADAMEGYWTYLEEIREECYGTEGVGSRAHHIADFYTAERLAVAQAKIDRARAQAVEGPEIYQRRIDFAQAGLDFTRLITDSARIVRKIENREDHDGGAQMQLDKNWDKLRALREEQPGAVNWTMYLTRDGSPHLDRGAAPIRVP